MSDINLRCEKCGKGEELTLAWQPAGFTVQYEVLYVDCDDCEDAR